MRKLDAGGAIDRLRSGLTLDKKNGWIAGVCAGCANVLNTDPTFVRVGVVVAGVFMPKLVIAAYLVAWLLLNDR